MDNYGGISHIYLLHLCIWIICCFIDCHDGRAKSRVSSKGHILFIFITFKYIHLKSVHYGPKPKAIISHDWCDVLGLYFSSYGMWKSSTYFEDKIIWNLLESTPARISLIDLSHKWTRILFMISNSKFGIWICSHISAV